MDNKFYSLTILGGSEPMIQQYAVNSILSCNEETCQYGLVLTVEQAHALVLSRNQGLKASGRIELGGGVPKNSYNPSRVRHTLPPRTTRKHSTAS